MRTVDSRRRDEFTPRTLFALCPSGHLLARSFFHPLQLLRCAVRNTHGHAHAPVAAPEPTLQTFTTQPARTIQINLKTSRAVQKHRISPRRERSANRQGGRVRGLGLLPVRVGIPEKNTRTATFGWMPSKGGKVRPAQTPRGKTIWRSTLLLHPAAQHVATRKPIGVPGTGRMAPDNQPPSPIRLSNKFTRVSVFPWSRGIFAPETRPISMVKDGALIVLQWGRGNVAPETPWRGNCG